jgi:hypothetical protein
MENEAKTPKTLQEAIVYFADPERAFQFGTTVYSDEWGPYVGLDEKFAH